MSSLRDRKCVALPAGTPALDVAAVTRLKSQVASDWSVGPDGKSLMRDFRFKDYYRTMSFVNAVAHVANVEDHHPDLEVGYNRCRVIYSTHSVGGLSENDFICAAKVDALGGW